MNMAAKVGPAAVSYGIGVQNRYSAFLDDDDGFATPASIIANSKRIVELSKQQKSAAPIAPSKSNNQSNHNNNPSGGAGKSGVKSANLNKHSDSRGTQQNDSKRNDTRRGQQQRIGSTTQSANSSVQSAPKQQNGGGSINNYQNHISASTGHKLSRASQSNGHNKMTNKHHHPNASHNPMDKENDEVNQQRGRFPRQNNQRPIVKRSSFNQDGRKAQLPNDEGAGPAVVQSNEEEKRRRQQKRALDMKHKDPEKREAKRQQSNQTAQSNDGAADSASSQGQGTGRGRRQFQDGEKTSEEVGRNQKGGPGVRNRNRRPEGENGGDRRENSNRGPRNDRPQRNRNGFGTGSRGSRGSRSEDHGKFGSEKQRPIPNFSDKSDFPSLAS